MALLAVSFRFYAELNDFLPADVRGRRFPHAVAPQTSVKDAIESLGVPHPEVDVLLVNGEAEDFTRRLREADRVSAYPAFRSIDLTGFPRVGVEPPSPVRFVLDVHLGKLASLLRLVGMDAIVLDEDADIAGTGAREGRVVLTRDVGLLKRSAVRHGYWIRQTDPARQILEVLERYPLLDHMRPFTRCLRCNTPLVAVAPETVMGDVPPRTAATFDQFWRCPGCSRVYWRGSHYERLAQLIARLRGAAGRGRSAEPDRQ